MTDRDEQRIEANGDAVNFTPDTDHVDDDATTELQEINVEDYEAESPTRQLLGFWMYLVAAIALQSPGGKLGDRIGQWRAFGFGQALLAVGAIAGFLAPTLWLLTASRVLMAAVGLFLTVKAWDALSRTGVSFLTTAEWQPDRGRFGIADVTQHGAPLEVDPRHVLKQAVRAWREMDLEPQIAFELEFYLCERADDGSWEPADLPSHRVYGTGMSVDPSGAVHASIQLAHA